MNIRSLLVMVYSASLALTGFIFRLVKARDRAVLLVSFPDNARALLDEYVSSAGRLKWKSSIQGTPFPLQMNILPFDRK